MPFPDANAWRVRHLLTPLGWIYGAIIRLRHRLYDGGIWPSRRPEVRTLCVGNLSTGGTGKTPFVEYLVTRLQGRYAVATLSRGYGRRTRGFRLADLSDTADTIGDEPMQLHLRFPEVPVAVGEDRVSAVGSLLRLRPRTGLVILDDAFQHRRLRAGFNILLTDYSLPYTRDRMLPAGNLRDHPTAAARADVVVVTKCPPEMGAVEAGRRTAELGRPPAEVFFSCLRYAPLRDFHAGPPPVPDPPDRVLLVCGIADPAALVRHLQTAYPGIELLRFPDHHRFRPADIDRILAAARPGAADDAWVVTTEKDAVRLEPFRDRLASLRLAVQPVSHAFMFSDEARFDGIIDTFMGNGRQAVGGAQPLADR
jgi:tetraacyldisaccharide 4'-kinase